MNVVARQKREAFFALDDRAIQYAATSRFILDVSGILGRPVVAGR
jgi:hypothetical protein